MSDHVISKVGLSHSKQSIVVHNDTHKKTTVHLGAPWHNTQ
jgi:hypothetical protein